MVRSPRRMGRSQAVFVSMLTISALAAGCSRKAEPPRADPGSVETKLVAPAPTEHAAGSGAASAASATTRGPFNVLLLSIDSLRADMPWAGYAKPIAPHLTELAKQATIYTHAYSLSSFTSKSLGPMMAGRYPSELARTGAFFTKYLASNELLGEVLEPEGVPCVAGMAHAYLDRGPAGANIDQGFSTWRTVPGITFDYNKDPYVTSDKLTKLAEEELSDPKVTRGPFFAWMHYMDPHDVYNKHEESPDFGSGPRGRYDQEIFFTDLWIGKLLDWVKAQPWGARTVIVVTADHGEFFGEHGRTRHAFELYEEVVHVPLFFVVPGQPPRSIDVPRSHVDLARTIADLVGAKPPKDARGESLAPELLGGPPAAARDVVCDLPEDDYNERRRSLLHGHTKIIAFGKDQRFELYDLASDPGEQHNLWGKDRELTDEMRDRYRTISRTIEEREPVGGIHKRL